MAAALNLDHKGSFSSSIDWRSQKLEKSCATGSKVENISKIYKIAGGDHSHETIQDLQIESYIAYLVELSELSL